MSLRVGRLSIYTECLGTSLGQLSTMMLRAGVETVYIINASRLQSALGFLYILSIPWMLSLEGLSARMCLKPDGYGPRVGPLPGLGTPSSLLLDSLWIVQFVQSAFDQHEHGP